MPKQCPTRGVRTRQRITRKDTRVAGRRQAARGGPSTKSQMHYVALTRLQVQAVWPKILEGLIEKAINGGCPQTRLLLDLCESTGIDGSQSDHRYKQQLCDALLEGLKLSSLEHGDVMNATTAGWKSIEEKRND